MINSNLQALAQKLLKRLKRQDNDFALTLEQVRQEINKVSTDYTNFSPDMEQQVMDILKNKNQSQIANGDLKFEETPIVTLEEQTLDNLTEENTPQESNTMNDNNNNGGKMVQSQSNALTFNDDFDKAIEVRNIAITNGIQLSNTQALSVAEKMPNVFDDIQTMQIIVIDSLEVMFGAKILEQKKQLAEKLAKFRENRKIEQDRARLEFGLVMNDVVAYTEATNDAILQMSAASVGMSVEQFKLEVMKRMGN